VIRVGVVEDTMVVSVAVVVVVSGGG